MAVLRLYRLAFAPALAAIVVLAFSLDGVPEPVEPSPVTLTFEGGRAAATAREVASRGPERAPGSEGDLAAADYVRERFEALDSGEVAVQEFEVDVDGDEETLRNVVMTLPGASERTVVVIAGRDSRSGAGVTTSAAATGVLIELAQQLGVADRERTVVLASTDGASSEAQGAKELVGALPDPGLVDAVLVISQPGVADQEPPHIVTSSSGDHTPAIVLVRTAEAQLAARATRDSGLPGPFAQLARLALPGASGEQAALLGEGLDAVTVSGAGEVPIDPADDDPDAIDPTVLSGYGSALLATLGALDAAGARSMPSPDTYVRFSANVVPGWTLALLALTLLIPPAAFAVSVHSRAARAGQAPGRALSWVAGPTTPRPSSRRDRAPGRPARRASAPRPRTPRGESAG